MALGQDKKDIKFKATHRSGEALWLGDPDEADEDEWELEPDPEDEELELELDPDFEELDPEFEPISNRIGLLENLCHRPAVIGLPPSATKGRIMAEIRLGIVNLRLQRLRTTKQQ